MSSNILARNKAFIVCHNAIYYCKKLPIVKDKCIRATLLKYLRYKYAITGAEKKN